MKNYTYQNNLISKKQLRELLAWSFTTYNSMQACSLADELKFLGFQYASQAGISISIEDLRIPFIKTIMIERATQEITNAEKIYLKGHITNVERFQKIIDTWNLTSESLKDQIIFYFKNYDPLNSVYIMAFSGARGNLSQVRQLVGMRGLMSDPSGEIMNLPIKKNFREGLTITDYLMSGYGARKGIVDTALKTANSGYLTRRLIDVSQDIIIREKDCLTDYSILFTSALKLRPSTEIESEKLLGCSLQKLILDSKTETIIAKAGTQITPELIKIFNERQITNFHIRSPFTCKLYRAICQKCYGWDLASENLVDIGEAIGILAGQSIGEPGTQLTMRTFHTGGIFTSEARQQIISPLAGIIQLPKLLKTTVLRTNRGEEVLVTKNSGFLLIVPENAATELRRIELGANTILFPRNNQYISRDTVIGELINTNRQFKVELKPILSETCGEIFIPSIKRRINNSQLIWLLFGKLFQSPKNAFLNFYSDYKINKYSYVSRSKITTHYDGIVKLTNQERSLGQCKIRLTSFKYCFRNAQVKELNGKLKFKTYLVDFETSKYLVEIQTRNFQKYLDRTRDGQVGNLITNKFQTLVGGTVFYDHRILFNKEDSKSIISYFYKRRDLKYYTCPIQYMTMVWLEEEIHKVNEKPDNLLVAHGDFISPGFELVSNIFSKTSGLVLTKQKAGIVKTIIIKSGVVYEGNKFKNIPKKVYYPGEQILPNIVLKSLSFCEFNIGKKSEQVLVRPIKLYEVSRITNPALKTQNSYNSSSSFNFHSRKLYTYKSYQTIKAAKTLNLILDLLLITDKTSKLKNFNIQLSNNSKNKIIELQITENLPLSDYVVPYLKYQNLKSCILVQKTQFLSKYMLIGYLETFTDTSIEIVQFKVKQQDSKKILVISNDDCFIVNKGQLTGKKINDFITSSSHIAHIGKIILENTQNFTVQKGRPYFFPNCLDVGVTDRVRIQYKIFPSQILKPSFKITQSIAVKYIDITKLSSKKTAIRKFAANLKLGTTIEFSKFFLKRNEKFYSCLVPQFFKKVHLNQVQPKFSFQKFVCLDEQNKKFKIFDSEKEFEENVKLANLTSTILIKKAGNFSFSDYQLSLLRFSEHPFKKSTKSVGLYSITEDFFEQETNSVFCKNKEFIEAGKTLGLLNLEKEITGDIVQGLPRIEEILEARKKSLILKNIPTSQKRGLLTQMSSLDTSFEFKKLGLPIIENDKINPHKLLKVYFNYYGLTKQFVCSKDKQIFYNRLTNNYEGSYKSLKKVQFFILHSVQAVYKSQGVKINDKHLEVIIKQMTTKVLITYEGNAPLLRREVVDLYHIKYINKIVSSQMKETACYVPLLMGITKAALNNPSFISAASFQETTRVLTKAAIEGRIDWLRGLKENIIIGHLIPAGTGSQNYKMGFRKKLSNQSLFHNNLENQKPRQIF